MPLTSLLQSKFYLILTKGDDGLSPLENTKSGKMTEVVANQTGVRLGLNVFQFGVFVVRDCEPFR